MADEELAYIEAQLELMKDAPYDGYTLRLYAVLDWMARGDSA